MLTYIPPPSTFPGIRCNSGADWRKKTAKDRKENIYPGAQLLVCKACPVERAHLIVLLALGEVSFKNGQEQIEREE